MPANHVPAESNPDDDGLGVVSFAFVGGSQISDGINLQDLGLTFEDGQPDIDTGRRHFSNSISELNQSLTGYLAELIPREAKLPELLASSDTDPLVLAASDRVHDALFNVRVGHLAYTGRPFLGGPLMRQDEEPHENHERSHDELDFFPEDPDEDATYGPTELELGLLVALNQPIHSGNGSRVQVVSARVYENGIMVQVEAGIYDRVHNDRDKWRQRKNSMPEFELVADDPTTKMMFTASQQSMDFRDFNKITRTTADFWIPHAQKASKLACTLNITNIPDYELRETTLSLNFELDTRDMRNAYDGRLLKF